jgi:hypothetical protein
MRLRNPRIIARQSVVAGAVEDSNGVGEKVGHGVQGFDGAFGAAGKIDDEGAMPDDGDATREDGGGRFFGAFAAEFLGDAGNGALGDVQSGFGSIVARAEAGAAGGEDEIDAARVGEFAKLAAKAGRIVGTAERGGDFPAEFANAFDERGAGEIFAFTAGDGITDGEDGDTHREIILYAEERKSAREIWGVCDRYRLLTESTEKKQKNEGFIAQKACDGAEILTPQTSFEMTNDS